MGLSYSKLEQAHYAIHARVEGSWTLYADAREPETERTLAKDRAEQTKAASDEEASSRNLT